MSSGKKILLAVVVVVVIGAATAISLTQGRERGVEVRLEKVTRRDLVSTVTVSGNIRARRAVDISADVMGRIIELNVEEGEEVDQGTVLLRIDPSQMEAAVSQAQARLSQAQAQAAQQRANLLQAQRAYDRASTLWSSDSTLVSRQQLEDAETAAEVAGSLAEASDFGVSQAQAALEEAEDNLSKTIIRAPISGTVTRLNVEAGETVVIGTMNNPGSLILTVSDLSVVEAVVEVDETDVPQIALGDSAMIELDAFPNRMFSGRVTEIGNSAIIPPSQTAGTGQTAAIDFEVVITLDDPGVVLRPDLSATADIITAVRENVLTIPIISLTVREPDSVAAMQEAAAQVEEEEDQARERQMEGPLARSQAPAEIEGVFVVRDRIAYFTPVEIGITGQEHFEVISGVSEGDIVVAGPYQQVREMADSTAVQAADNSTVKLDEDSGNPATGGGSEGDGEGS